MKKIILNSFISAIVFGFTFVGIVYLSKARQTNNPNLTEPAPTGGLYVNNNETLSAAKRNAMASRINIDYPQETLSSWTAGTEQDTGTKWIDGKTIYRKVINMWTMANVGSTSTLITVSHNISNLYKYVKFEWIVYPPDLNLANQYQLWESSGSDWTTMMWWKTSITLRYKWNRSTRTAYIVAYYTKS